MIHKTLKQFIIASVIALITSSDTFAQLTVNSAPTPSFLVTNVLLGSGVSATGITYTGAASARGSFNYSGPSIGFTSGVLLATGDINTAIGPNTAGGAGTNLFASGDADLNSVSSNTTFDAAILEFDFVPLSDTIKFRYVFASEEYMEFVSSGVNDAFGFFISGPGITGPYAGGAKNIALIPGTSTPVTIDNVNATTTPSLYINNETPPGATVQYDGLTVPLTAISPVQCGETYHIKIAIADAGDGVWDSGVFLEAGSFSSVGVSIIPEISYGGANDSTLYEGCGNACIYFVRTSGLTTTDTIDVTIGGTAVNGTDYYDNSVGPGALLPTQLVFLPGQDSISFCINAVSDSVMEGLESITLSIQPQGSALCVPPPTLANIYLSDYSQMNVTTMDTAICNSGTFVLNTAVTGGVEPYTYSWTGGLAAVEDPTLNATTTNSYILTVSDACFGSPDPTPAVVDTATVVVTNIPVISYSAPVDSIYEGCGSSCIYIVRTSPLTTTDTINITIGGTGINGGDYYNVSGGPGTALPTQVIFAPGQDSISFCINALADPTIEGSEYLALAIQPQGSALCVPVTTIDTIYLFDYSQITVTTLDTTLCNLGGTVVLNTVVSGGVQPYTYSWTGGLGTTEDPTATVTTTTSFVITVNDACFGSPDPTPAALDTATVIVATFAPLTASAGADVIVCPGDVVFLSGSVTGGGAPYIYNWSTVAGTDTVSAPFSLNTVVTANNSGVYQLSVTDVCNNTQFDQVSVTVEPSCDLSIPNVITPDHQGPLVNETFYIDNLDKFPGSSVIIYNRWGKKVYESSDYQNNWNGGNYSDGTYYYVLTVPPSGLVTAKLKRNPLVTYDIKTGTEGENSTFAGYFQIIRSK